MGRAVDADYPLQWTRASRPAGRVGTRCRKVPRSDARRYRVAPGTEHVEFMDGQRFVVDTRGLSKA